MLILFFLICSCSFGFTVPQNSFTTGQVSPLIEGRSDYKGYKSGARIMENMFPYVLGDVTKRPGTEYIADALMEDEAISFPYILAPANSNCYVINDDFTLLRTHSNGGDMPDMGSYASAASHDGSMYAFSCHLDYDAATGPMVIFNTSDGSVLTDSFDMTMLYRPDHFSGYLVSHIQFSEDGAYVYAIMGATLFRVYDGGWVYGQGGLYRWDIDGTNGTVIKEHVEFTFYQFDGAMNTSGDTYLATRTGDIGKYGLRDSGGDASGLGWSWADNRGKHFSGYYLHDEDIFAYACRVDATNSYNSVVIAANDTGTADFDEYRWDADATDACQAFGVAGYGSFLYFIGIIDDDNNVNLRRYTVDNTNDTITSSETASALVDASPITGDTYWDDYYPTAIQCDEDGNVLIFFSGADYHCLKYTPDLSSFTTHTITDGGVDMTLTLLVADQAGEPPSGWSAGNGFVVCDYTVHAPYPSLTGNIIGAGSEVTRLLPFQYSTDDSYVLGFGDEFVSFFRTVNGVGGQIQAP